MNNREKSIGSLALNPAPRRIIILPPIRTTRAHSG